MEIFQLFWFKNLVDRGGKERVQEKVVGGDERYEMVMEDFPSISAGVMYVVLVMYGDSSGRSLVWRVKQRKRSAGILRKLKGEEFG